MSIKVQQDILNHLREKADKPSETKKAASDKLFSSDLKDKLREFGLEVDSEGKRESGKKGTDESEVKKTRLKNGMTVSLKVSKEKLGGEAGEKSAKKIADKSDKPVSEKLVIRDGEKVKARINSAGDGGSAEKVKTSGLSEAASSEQKDSGEKVIKGAVKDSEQRTGDDKSETSDKKGKKGTSQAVRTSAEGEIAKSSETESSQEKSKSSANKKVEAQKSAKLRGADQGNEKGPVQTKKDGFAGFQQVEKTKVKHQDGVKGETQEGKSDKADKEFKTEGKKSPKGEAKFETTGKKAGNIERLAKGEQQQIADDKKAVSAAKSKDKVDTKASEGEKVQRTANNSASARQEPEVRKNGETEQFKTKTREIVKDEDGKERRIPLNRDSARISRSNIDKSQGSASERTASQRGQANGNTSGQPVQSVKESSGRVMETTLKSGDAKNVSDDSAGKKEDLKTPEMRAGERLNQNQTQNQFTYIRREVAGKIVEVSRAQQNSSSQSKDGWQRQRIQLGNGQSLDVAVRNSGGRLNIQLGSMNSELARLLQTNIMDLKAHLEEQLSSEVELEFEMQGDQQSTPEQQNASDSSTEEATGDNSAATGLSQDAVVPRFIGTNQNEWTG